MGSKVEIKITKTCTVTINSLIVVPMRCVLFFCWILPVVIPIRLFSQRLSDSARLDALQKMNDDSSKVNALYKASRSFYQERKNLYALQLSQEASILSQKLDIGTTIQHYKTVNTGLAQQAAINSASTDIKNQIAAQAIQLNQLKKRLDTLTDMKNEFNRRTLSLSEDLIATREQNISDLSAQQLITTQLVHSRQLLLYWFISGAIAILLLLSFAFYQFYRRRRTQFQLELNHLNNKVLRTQLNPHFIFNALNSVKKLIQKQPELASVYLSKFSTLMRQVLENSTEEKISLKEEIAMLENYLQLESLRIHHGFDYKVTMDENVDAANTMIPPLIFQPVLENAIWHGLDLVDRKGNIKMSFSEKNDLLEAVIEDDGIGLDSAKKEKAVNGKKYSLGLQITRQRIELLNRKAKSKGFFSQLLLQNGSRVEMAIPI